MGGKHRDSQASEWASAAGSRLASDCWRASGGVAFGVTESGGAILIARDCLGLLSSRGQLHPQVGSEVMASVPRLTPVQDRVQRDFS